MAALNTPRMQTLLGFLSEAAGIIQLLAADALITENSSMLAV